MKLYISASGYHRGRLFGEGSGGYYWLSTSRLDSVNNAYYLFFYSGNALPDYYSDYYYGHSIRNIVIN